MGDKRWHAAAGEYDADDCDEFIYAMKVGRRTLAAIRAAEGDEFADRYLGMIVALLRGDVDLADDDDVVSLVRAGARGRAPSADPTH